GASRLLTAGRGSWPGDVLLVRELPVFVGADLSAKRPGLPPSDAQHVSNMFLGLCLNRSLQ
ncbi:hypothetical protein CVE29_27290, partial [Pseudomonas syringae pv. actinidiae]|nr:hypothetical protein [Pseudomonas syringae pv. actinidiae]